MVDLGAWWEQETRLPIPLGCIIAQRSLGSVLVQQADTLGGLDDVGVTQVVEEAGQTQGVHATGDDGGGVITSYSIHYTKLYDTVRT